MSSSPQTSMLRTVAEVDSDVEEDKDSHMKDPELPLLEYSSSPITCRQNFADCSNVFKAFIGSAMVALPFATSQTGIGFTIIGTLVIATLTDHCCVLIVKCKQMIIANIINEKREQGIDEIILREEERNLGSNLSFGKIGKVCLGKKGVILTNTALMVTQLGFTTGYFIFLGNTMRTIVEYFVIGPNSNTTDTTVKVSPQHENNNVIPAQLLPNNFTSSSKTLERSIIYYFDMLTVSITPHFLNSSVGFACFLLLPLVMLILISFIRNLRKLGPVSVIANAAMTAAFGATSIYIIHSMKSLPDPLLWFNVSKFPILFGQVTAAFEGIGTVIPIESSMGENRRKYPAFLHLSVTGLFLILTSFGIVGYLAYGIKTCQIITANLTGPIAVALQILLFIGVLFTYPLQIYPCIQITERIILKMRRWRDRKKVLMFQQRESDGDDEREQLTDDVPEHTSKNIQLKNWESNIVRASLVTLTAAIALAFRLQFAYIASLTGSIGSSLLLYIIPSLCHIHLTGSSNRWLKTKDILLVIFGIIGGITGVAVTIMELVNSFSGHHQDHC